MSNKHLNIADHNGTTGSGWQETTLMNDTAISKIKDKSAKTSNALNAIPSPFSRLHVFETAFKLVTEDLRENSDRSSKIYKELVSDCLDALELLFNYKYHISQNDKIEFINWSKEKDLSTLKTSIKGQVVFAKTLDMYLSEDFDNKFNEISIIKYKGYVLAGTSPFTLMFTSANLDKKDGLFRNKDYQEGFDLLKPNTGYKYFSRVVPFSKRSDAFKKYLFDLFDENQILKREAGYLWNYLVEEKIDTQLNRNVSLKLQALKTTNGGNFSVLAVPLSFNDGEDAMDIFLDHIIKVNYPINKECFYTPSYIEDAPSRNFDFLLPIKVEFLKNIKLEDIPRLITYEFRGDTNLKVLVQNPNKANSKFEKTYVVNQTNKQDGKILDYTTGLELNFTIGIYPFLRVVESDLTISEKYNDYYKVLLGIDSNNSLLKNESFSLKFFKSTKDEFEEITKDGTLYNVKRYDRTLLEQSKDLGSIYYQINNSTFDIIKVELMKIDGIDSPAGLIIPQWKVKQIGNKQFDFAVDFGTTNTFIAYTDDINHQSHPKPFDITTNDMQMVLLNQPRKQSNLTVTETFSGGRIATIGSELIAQEFIPSVIIPHEKKTFKQPFRTAVYQKTNLDESQYSLLDNININFAYQTSSFTDRPEFQEIVSNLKWNIQTDRVSKLRVDFYLKELLRIIRNKVILNDGNPTLTNVTWFVPHSLTPAAINSYKELWDKHFKETLKSESILKRVSESDAPFYYLQRKSAINDRSSVLTVDIGGGSTDISLFEDDIPKIGSSFNFAGNVFWGNGYNDFKDVKDNGLFEDLKDPIYNRIKNSLLKTTHEELVKNKGTEEIINFWLVNDDKTEITKELKADKYKFIFLVHFASVIYHSAQLIKSNNGKPVTCLVFSGNGSKYIDLLNQSNYLSKIAGFIFRNVINSSALDPQIILPTENRKESTCYGGIYKTDSVQLKTVTYLGTSLGYEKIDTIKTYKDLFNDASVLIDVEKNVIEFVELLIKLNDEMNFKTHFNIDLKISRLKNFLLAKVKGNLLEGYSKRKSKVDADNQISDSLFFYPLIGLIHQLTQINNETLSEFEPKKHLYTNCPDGHALFFSNSLKVDKVFDSVYQIEILESSPNEATFTIVNETPVFKRAIGSITDVLDPVSEYEVYPDSSDQAIEVINKGILHKQGDEWIVTQKLKIRFI